MTRLRALLLVCAAGQVWCEEPAHAPAAALAGAPTSPYVAAFIARLPAAGFEGGARVKGKENQLSVGGYRFRAGDVTLTLGADYQYTRYTYEGISGRNRDLHRLQVPLAFARSAGGWDVAGYVAPGVSTSSNVFKDPFGKLRGDDFIVTGRLEGRRDAGSHRWLVGAGYDRAFGRPRGYPVAGVEWSPAADLFVRAAFPDPGLWYVPAARHALSLRVFPAGHEWHVWSEELDADFDYRVEAVRAQATWSVRLWRAVFLDVGLGFEAAREHHFTDDLGQRLRLDVEDRWLFGVGLRAGHGPPPATHGSQLAAGLGPRSH